ncbi:MAG: SRPBCC family protein [Herpetosiphonaceae bacterium]|nr:SRPBCC family protein [Herpetosiphonaceae bacterium]
MATKRFSSSALIHAPAQVVYGIIADYRHDHPQILPKPPFVSLDVEQGGTGAGTIIRAQMRVLGRLQVFHAVVSEPEPGRVLVETNDNGYVTSFTVEPRTDGQQSYVTIATEMTGRAGLLGALEGWFVTRLLRPVYVKELEKLEALAATRETSTPPTRTY